MLEAYSQLATAKPEEFHQILSILESFLVRRMICGLTAKNYNKLFIDLLKNTTGQDLISISKVIEFLRNGTGDSLRFPDDDEFRTSFVASPVYSKLAQYKVNAVLLALENAFEDAKSEGVALGTKLTIEHLMPQSWQEHWPISNNEYPDLAAKQNAIEQRDAVIHTFGNLTLITSSLNPSLSNSNWEVKRPEILKFSKLNLTRYFHDTPVWNEDEINKRGLTLFEKALEIWPYP